MQTVIILRGLPASGKTTLAREYVTKGYKRINRDDLRAMLDNGKWSPNNETFVRQVKADLLVAALKQGHNVVLDDTHLIDSVLFGVHETIRSTRIPVTVEELFINTPLEECIFRDSLREARVGEEVIDDMHGRMSHISDRGVTVYGG